MSKTLNWFLKLVFSLFGANAGNEFDGGEEVLKIQIFGKKSFSLSAQSIL
jgi:hypothetical protein